MPEVYSSVMSEVIVTVAAESSVPLYRQIVDQIRLHIDSGALAAGAPLPSVRSLATQLGVHFNTIAEAYRDLADEGWIELSHGKRAVVRAPGCVPVLAIKDADGLRQRLRHLVQRCVSRGFLPWRSNTKSGPFFRGELCVSLFSRLQHSSRLRSF